MAVKVVRKEYRWETNKKVSITLPEQRIDNVQLYTKTYDDVILEDFSKHGFALRFDLGYIPVIPLGKIVVGQFKKDGYPICTLEVVPRNMNIEDDSDYACRIGCNIVGGDIDLWENIFNILKVESGMAKENKITTDRRADVRYKPTEQ